MAVRPVRHCQCRIRGEAREPGAADIVRALEGLTGIEALPLPFPPDGRAGRGPEPVPSDAPPHPVRPPCSSRPGAAGSATVVSGPSFGSALRLPFMVSQGSASRSQISASRIVHHCADEVTEPDSRGQVRRSVHVGMGVHRGFADLIVLSGGQVLFLEAKSRIWRLRKSQEVFRDTVCPQGFGWAPVALAEETRRGSDLFWRVRGSSRVQILSRGTTLFEPLKQGPHLCDGPDVHSDCHRRAVRSILPAGQGSSSSDPVVRRASRSR